MARRDCKPTHSLAPFCTVGGRAPLCCPLAGGMIAEIVGEVERHGRSSSAEPPRVPRRERSRSSVAPGRAGCAGRFGKPRAAGAAEPDRDSALHRARLMAADAPGTLALLAKIGYREVEIAGLVGRTPAGFRAIPAPVHGAPQAGRAPLHRGARHPATPGRDGAHGVRVPARPARRGLIM